MVKLFSSLIEHLISRIILLLIVVPVARAVHQQPSQHYSARMKGLTLLLLWTLLQVTFISAKNCHFPSQWTGKWFQSGEKHYISINLTSIQNKGVCIENDGDKFLIEDKSDNGCYRCVVIHVKHNNVLQYKETYCDTREKSLEGLCNLITGDAPLYSMFRADARPVPCPFHQPPFTFTYSRGAGECNYPLSRAEACTEDSRMLLKYQACADTNSEAASEELICLASWKDGSVKYLVGRLEHSRATSEEDRYRCFVYEKKGHRYEIAMSGDATCNGISSPTEGSRTITLSKVDSGHHGGGGKCKFPPWLTIHKTWHTLDHSRTYHVKGHNSTLIVTHKGEGDVRIHCQKMFPPMSEDYALLAAHVTKGCKSGYYCMLFHRRTNHVIELQESGNATYMEEDACHARHFKKDVSPFTTLITDAPMLQKCPYMGRRYAITGGLESENVLANSQTGQVMTATDNARCQDRERQMLMSVGCQKPETLEIHSDCGSEKFSEFNCHGDWQENLTRYVIASPVSRKSGDASRLCFVLYNSPEDTGSLQVTTVKETCHRNVSQLGLSDNSYISTFNMTAHGVCSDSGSSLVISSWIHVILIPVFLAGRQAR